MNEFSIYHLFRLLVKNIFIILLTAVVLGAVTFCYNKFSINERYSASGSIVVTNGGIIYGNNNQYEEGKTQNSDITASINLLDTVQDLLSSNDGLYEELSQKLNGKYTASQLKNFSTVTKADNYSMVIRISFELTNPDDAVNITNTFLQLIPNSINSIIPGTSAHVNTVSESSTKTYPRVITSTIIAMFIGAFLAYIIVYIISLFNTTIKSEEEFKDRYNIPVLGDIPDFETAKSGKYAKSYYKGGSYYGN